MTQTIGSSATTPSAHQLQVKFLQLLPRIDLHARISFRVIRCPQHRDELIAETKALAWKWYIRMAQRGKDAGQFVSVFARFAVRAAFDGRRLCGQQRANEVLSERAQREKRFQVEPLPISTRRPFEVLQSGTGQRQLGAYEERLQDNKYTPVPDQVAFRCDFPVWLSSRSERDRQIIQDMAQNEPTFLLAQKYKVSPARISQLRREYHEDWQRFCDEQG